LGRRFQRNKRGIKTFPGEQFKMRLVKLNFLWARIRVRNGRYSVSQIELAMNVGRKGDR